VEKGSSFAFVDSSGLLFPLITSAGDYKLSNGQTVHYQGFVPCGKTNPAPAKTDSSGNIIEPAESPEVTMTCQFCHLFVMIDGIIDYFLGTIVPPVAILIIVIGGVMFYFAGANPAMLQRAKSLIKGVLIGIALIYGSYLIVGTFLSILGVADVSGLSDWAKLDPFKINCNITPPPAAP
jgi:hypothetical protein